MPDVVKRLARVHDPKDLPKLRAIFGDSISCFDSEFDCLSAADCAVILTERNAYLAINIKPDLHTRLNKRARTMDLTPAAVAHAAVGRL